MRVLQRLGQLYEQMTSTESSQLNHDVTKLIIGRSVFLWLSLKKSNEDKDVECEDFFAFLEEKSNGFLACFCEALRHVRQKEKMVRRATPFALKVIKETKRLKALTADMPLTVALMTDELYCLTIMGVAGVQFPTDFANGDNIEPVDAVRPMEPTRCVSSSISILSDRQTIRDAYLDTFIELQHERVIKG